MLAKRFRLPIQRVLRKRARLAQNEYFSIKVFDTRLFHRRFGAVVSRKVFNKAVKRNWLRRIIFAFLKLNQEQLPVKDYMIIAKPKAATLTGAAVAEQLKKILFPRQSF